MKIRTVHEKLLRLLSAGNQQAVSASRVFEPFSGLNPLHYNPYTEVCHLVCLLMCFFSMQCSVDESVKRVLFPVVQPLWKAAVAQFERAIAPAEHEIASKLKACLGDVQDSSQQVHSNTLS